jgi:iron complex transport system substrate-binding protein
MFPKIFRIMSCVLFVLFSFNPWSVAARQVVTDQAGNTVIVDKPFKRIISLYGAHTENLFSLGLDQEIIGVSANEAFPPKTLKKAVFSYHDDIEKFIASNPDLVLVRPMITQGYPDFVKALQKMGITVVSLQPRTIDDVYSYWLDLGILTGHEDEARAMIEKCKTELQRIRAIVSTIPEKNRKKVYFEAIHRKMKTFSPSSIAMFALETAGGINVAADANARHNTNIADYGKEHILSQADNIDVYLAQKGVMNHLTVKTIAEESGFQAIKAVREGQIHIIDEKIVSRPTLRLLDGIQEIGRYLYPERFIDINCLRDVPILSRAQFAEMYCQIMKLPLKTPDYRQDILKRANGKHRYGDFIDIDYTGKAYKFVETAVYRGVFPDSDSDEFFPDKRLTRSTLAYALFVSFDLPDVKSRMVIKDVAESDPFFEQIRTLVSLGLMDLTTDGLFRPADTVSGKEAEEIIAKARQVAP